MNKEILILGADGYVGTELCNQLSNHNYIYKITRSAIDDVNNIVINEPTNEEYINSLRKVIDKIKPDIIINLIWGGSFGDARNDYELQDKFVDLANKIYNECLKTDIKYVVAGTISECEAISSDNVTEYAKAKLRLLRLLQEQDPTGDSFLWLRFANIFGGVDNTGRFVVSTFKKILSNEPIAINTTGEQLFNSIHIKDAAEDIENILEHDMSGIVLVGANETDTLKSFVTRAVEVANSKSQLTLGDNIATSIDRQYFERNELLNNYEPNIALGLKETEGM